jgi:hypothetical protein
MIRIVQPDADKFSDAANAWPKARTRSDNRQGLKVNAI